MLRIILTWQRKSGTLKIIQRIVVIVTYRTCAKYDMWQHKAKDSIFLSKGIKKIPSCTWPETTNNDRKQLVDLIVSVKPGLADDRSSIPSL